MLKVRNWVRDEININTVRKPGEAPDTPNSTSRLSLSQPWIRHLGSEPPVPSQPVSPNVRPSGQLREQRLCLDLGVNPHSVSSYWLLILSKFLTSLRPSCIICEVERFYLNGLV